MCNGCGMDPITGMLWKCVRCHEYCICTECYMTGKHILEHEFDRFVTARYVTYSMMNCIYMYVQAYDDGCLTCQLVMLIAGV